MNQQKEGDAACRGGWSRSFAGVGFLLKEGKVDEM